MTNTTLSYLEAVLDCNGGFYIVSNKSTKGNRVTLDCVIQITGSNELLNLVSSLLLKGEVPHTIKEYRSYKIIIITGIYTISDFIFSMDLLNTKNVKIFKHFVALRIDRLKENKKARYEAEEFRLFNEMRALYGRGQKPISRRVE